MLTEPGQIVRVRSGRYLVEDVSRGAPAAIRTAGRDARVRMSRLDDDAQGEALDVLREREVGVELRVASWQAALHMGFRRPEALLRLAPHPPDELRPLDPPRALARTVASGHRGEGPPVRTPPPPARLRSPRLMSAIACGRTLGAREVDRCYCMFLPSFLRR